MNFTTLTQSLQHPKMSLDVYRKLYAPLSDSVKGSTDLFEEQAKKKLPHVDCKKIDLEEGI